MRVVIAARAIIRRWARIPETAPSRTGDRAYFLETARTPAPRRSARTARDLRKLVSSLRISRIAPDGALYRG